MPTVAGHPKEGRLVRKGRRLRRQVQGRLHGYLLGQKRKSYGLELYAVQMDALHQVEIDVPCGWLPV